MAHPKAAGPGRGATSQVGPDPQPPEADLGPSDHTVLINRLQRGDPVAFEALWQHYFVRLTRAARERLAVLRVSRTARDEEDIALSVLNCLHEGVAAGRFPDLQSRTSLWKLLLHLTACKVVDLSRREGSRRKSRVRVLPEVDCVGAHRSPGPGFLDRLASDDDQCAGFVTLYLEELEHRMSRLTDPQLRRVAELRLLGHTVAEIASEIGRSPRLVDIKLQRIRKIWSEVEVTDES